MHEPDKLRVPAAGASSGAAKTRERESERAREWGGVKTKALSAARELSRGSGIIPGDGGGAGSCRQIPARSCAREKPPRTCLTNKSLDKKRKNKTKKGAEGRKRATFSPSSWHGAYVRPEPLETDSAYMPLRENGAALYFS